LDHQDHPVITVNLATKDLLVDQATMEHPPHLETLERLADLVILAVLANLVEKPQLEVEERQVHLANLEALDLKDHPANLVEVETVVMMVALVSKAHLVLQAALDKVHSLVPLDHRDRQERTLSIARAHVATLDTPPYQHCRSREYTIQ